MLKRVVTDFNVFDINFFFFILCLPESQSVNLLNCRSPTTQAQLQYLTISIRFLHAASLMFNRT